jgi:hypothetical protein
MSTASTTLRSPDHFLVALIIDLRNKVHIRTLVGHYSELLPEINTLDPRNIAQNYMDLGGHRLVFLQNCLRTLKDFKQFYNFCVAEKIIINMESIFFDLYQLCETYTRINEYGKLKYADVYHRIRWEALKIKCQLSDFERKFDIKRITSPNHYVPIELGQFLKSVWGR